VKKTLLLGLFAAAVLSAQEYNHPVGQYPGDPKEDFAPALVPDATTYRNLALHRPAYHSSSLDYNQTAQLVTDGIKETSLPRSTVVTASAPPAAPGGFGGGGRGGVTVGGAHPWIEYQFLGGPGPLEIDRVELIAGNGAGRGGRAQTAAPAGPPATGGWSVVVSGSDDGQTWRELGRAAGDTPPTAQFRPSIAFAASARVRYLRIALEAPSVTTWRVTDALFFDQNARVYSDGQKSFNSSWISAGQGEEWVYVDLGAACTFDRVALYWLRRAAAGSIQASDDAATWKTLQALPAGAGPNDDIRLAQPAKARYVRVLMTKPTEGNYALSEMEVYGRGGFVAQAKPAPAPLANGRLHLAGGAWRLQRDSLVTANGETLSKPGFQDKDWVVATVPATILSSYWNIGALPDPNFGDNQLQISDSFFYADFWYRDEFTVPAADAGKRLWLNFDGINWKADVYVNGSKVGRIEGGFMRGKFDVTALLHPGAKNALAVRVEKNATPGAVKVASMQTTGLNGGLLGADNPTYHASIGWDWIPTIRGRNTGIWADVYLTTTGPVSIENPLVTTTLPLPATTSADVAIEATLSNHDKSQVSGTLRGKFGALTFETPVTIEAGAEKTVKLDPSTTPALRLVNPKLLWPAGYGDQNLYPVELSFVTAARQVSDGISFQAGVRQFTYSEDGNALRMWVNGRRFIPRGGNWGFPESNLRYRAREYDAAVRYHKEMNFTMIRDWVGQTGDEAFYDACDKWGIVVWQDFWLANPSDGPNPDDNELFLRNARDYILKIRNHASIGLYCGRNEGVPPKPIDDGLRQMIAELHPGLHYIPSSADDNQQGGGTYVVTGHGPYRAQPIKSYFADRATPKFHSEMGMPNVPTIESVKTMIPESALWPQNLMWGLHDYTLAGAQAGASFNSIIESAYGGAKDVNEWVTLAQFVNYDGYRAMFEAQSKNRMGLLIWMSHPAWPCFVWQTYDYYFEPTAAYFGARKASEPLHIQWNAATDNVEVVNYSGGNATGLSASVELLNMDGAVKWEKTATVDSPEDSVQTPIKMEYPQGLTPTHFIRLKLMRGAQLVSENFYLHGTEENNFKAIRELPKVNLEATTREILQSGRWTLTTELHNPSAQPALMVRLKAVREKSGDRILPAIYSDNYVALMPGERRTIKTELANADTRGERPRMLVEGFNTGEVKSAAVAP
jgi:beta-galactosidase/beta-glucuronidase